MLCIDIMFFFGGGYRDLWRHTHSSLQVGTQYHILYELLLEHFTHISSHIEDIKGSILTCLILDYNYHTMSPCFAGS